MNPLLIEIALGKLFENRCYVCRKKRGKGFVFHHIRYDGKSYRDYPTSKQYLENLILEIMKEPKNFLLLCRKHHFAIEKMKRYKKDTLQRLCWAALESHKD